MEILFDMFPHDEDKPQGTSTRLSSILEHNQMALEHLLPALISLYVDIETTGRMHSLVALLIVCEGGNQFYEKFGVRRQIAVLMRYLRNYPSYSSALHQLSK
jgi:ubiquitin conjugation factor E4 B